MNWHDYSTVAGMILQVTGTIDQQSLVWLFNSHWHDFLTVTGTILQQLRARFFYAGRILQQWCSLSKNPAMYQEYDTWSPWTLWTVDAHAHVKGNWVQLMNGDPNPFFIEISVLHFSIGAQELRLPKYDDIIAFNQACLSQPACARRLLNNIHQIHEQILPCLIFLHHNQCYLLEIYEASR